MKSFLKLSLLCASISFSFVATHANALDNSIQDFAVEPQFWWAEMHNSQLQLLIYGKDIAKHQIKLKQGKKVKLVKVDTTDSHNHVFVTLDLKGASPQTVSFDIIDNNKVIGQFDYQLLKRAANSAKRVGFNNQDVIYLITPDRFVNGDISNDNHPDMLEKINPDLPDYGGRFGGDIAGIKQALPYLKDLGVTQLWINPLLENNHEKYSYHGYSTTDYYQIDPRFGTNEDYKALVKAANDHGIGVIKDVVVNHIGSNHPWMSNFPSSTWINGQGKPDQEQVYTSHHRTTVQDLYATKIDRSEFEEGWFVPTMPDLNQRDPHLATYLIQNSIWWVEYAGLSGIREDTYSYADKAFLAKWGKAIMDEYPSFNIVGEEWSENPITISYWQQGKVNHDGYQSFTPSMMDFPIAEMLHKSLTHTDPNKGLMDLYEMLANDVVYADPTKLVLFEGNHDTNRIYSLLNEDFGLYQMAIAYVLTSNRIPQIFYGTEVLMTSPKEGRHDGVVRSPFPGGFAGDTVNALTGQGLNSAQKAAQHFIKTLLNYRKHSKAISQGSLAHYVPKDGVYVQFRQFKDENLMVIYHLGEHTTKLDLNRFNEHIKGAKQGRSIISQHTYSLDKLLTLSPKSVTMLSIK
ncbi:glycoside hydrolase family 13 protein [Shewanella aestuarii]|uniref:Glycoside hydrolase family 13 protein n=1 Tax=Shewanella aestuarii TaxID=1028752 RepID=A0A6G9QKP4_9GAMM|nr:glycoside hydrolase family 13 protein [Shewanella aestuarii]QIR14703.1 glycoside hydrolase family 13 protein [Shewanella aestuarii]